MFAAGKLVERQLELGILDVAGRLRFAQGLGKQRVLGDIPDDTSQPPGVVLAVRIGADRAQVTRCAVWKNDPIGDVPGGAGFGAHVLGECGFDALDVFGVNDRVPMGNAIGAVLGRKPVQGCCPRVPRQQSLGFVRFPDADIGGFHGEVEAPRQIEQLFLACLRLRLVAVAFAQEVQGEGDRHDHADAGGEAADVVEQHSDGNNAQAGDQPHDKEYTRAGHACPMAPPGSVENDQVRSVPRFFGKS